jgi:hypothetical protein
MDKTRNFKCLGTGNLAVRITCSPRNWRNIYITLASNEARTRYFNAGTTISFDIGYIINPPSFKESDSI